MIDSRSDLLIGSIHLIAAPGLVRGRKGAFLKHRLTAVFLSKKQNKIVPVAYASLSRSQHPSLLCAVLLWVRCVGMGNEVL